MTRWATWTGWRPRPRCGRAGRTWTSLVHLDLSDAEVGVDGQGGPVGPAVVLAVGGRGRRRRGPRRRARWRRDRRPGALTSTSRPAGTTHLEPPDVAAQPHGAAVERGEVADAGSGRAPSRRRRSGRLSRTSAAAHGRAPCRSSASQWSAAVVTAQGQRGDQPDEDQPAGAAVERADQQHHADGADRQRPGRPRRRPARRPGRAMPSSALGQGDQRQREPEEDRAAAARGARHRLVRRVRRGSRRRPGTTPARPGTPRRASSTGRADAAVGSTGGGDGAGRTGRVRGRLTRSPAPRSAHHAGQDQRPAQPLRSPHESPSEQQRRERPGQHQREAAGALVEGERRPGRCRPSGTQQPAGAVQQQAGAAEEDQHHEGHPQDHRVDVEVAGQAAGDAGDLAVAGWCGAAGRGRGSRRG